MIIFWKEDSNFNISTYKVTQDDRIINYTVASLLIISFLSSTLLNPILLYHHRSSGKKSITTFLFTCLAVSDCLTNLATPLVYSVFMISPKVRSELSDPLIHPFMIVACITGCFSQCVTTLLAVTRLMSFINPFKRIKNKVVKVYLVIYTIFMLIADIVPAIIMDRNIGLNDYEDAELFLIICFYLNIAHCLVGVICSVISSLYVFLIQPVSHSNTTDSKKQASVTILLMNAVYIITLASALLQQLVEYKIISNSVGFNTISFLFIPILTSAVNPVIFLVRVKSVRETLEALANSLRTLVAAKKTKKGIFQEEDAGL